MPVKSITLFAALFFFTGLSANELIKPGDLILAKRLDGSSFEGKLIGVLHDSLELKLKDHTTIKLESQGLSELHRLRGGFKQGATRGLTLGIMAVGVLFIMEYHGVASFGMSAEEIYDMKPRNGIVMGSIVVGSGLLGGFIGSELKHYEKLDLSRVFITLNLLTKDNMFCCRFNLLLN